jgi:tRNA (guanine37-N1)-methyltransferase
MRIDAISIFPEYFAAAELALLGKARDKGLVDLTVHDLRSWTHDVHRTVDDSPYGGGPGMVMRPEPWFAALRSVTGTEPAAPGAAPAPAPRVVVLTPSGRQLDQALAHELAAEPWIVLCCGRYEGIDQRVVDAWATDEISIGDYVLAGGEVAALALLEAVTRLLPGVLGNAESVADDSFSDGVLEGPVFTRPPEFEGRAVPPVLLSGDHGAVASWRREQGLARTRDRRPDLLPPDLAH